MPSNEPATTEGRRAAGPTLRGALLWAVVGAALFLGVGAALPVWNVPVLVSEGGSHLHYGTGRGPSGRAAGSTGAGTASFTMSAVRSKA